MGILLQPAPVNLRAREDIEVSERPTVGALGDSAYRFGGVHAEVDVQRVFSEWHGTVVLKVDHCDSPEQVLTLLRSALAKISL